MDFDTRYLQLLCEIGMVAGSHGQVAKANAIFDGLIAVRPDHPSPPIGKATVLLNTGRFDEAIDLLQNTVLANDPHNLTAKAFIGMAHAMASRNNEARSILQEVTESGSEDTAVSMAESILQVL